ncbi:sensor histidine kinase [Nonomuraea salmonea]|uniref:sensor histidine kinase n=1 Tax=Nonomuraea salmonea TaxID=46181 RepID=UPI002FEAF093
MAGFAGLYLRVAWTALERPHRNATPYALILLYALAAAMAPALGVMWVFASSFFLITAVATALPERALPLAAGATIAAGTAALPLLGESPAELWWIPLQAAVFTAAIRAFLRLNAANRALSEANVKVERLAVDNERLRFARDMHDLLGHSLAVMTVKSQLAARLADADPARARAEMEQVEELSRQALAEVREAISGYRELSLPDELDGARRALGTAGVRLEVAAGPLPRPRNPCWPGWSGRARRTSSGTAAPVPAVSGSAWRTGRRTRRCVTTAGDRKSQVTSAAATACAASPSASRSRAAPSPAALRRTAASCSTRASRCPAPRHSPATCPADLS